MRSGATGAAGTTVGSLCRRSGRWSLCHLAEPTRGGSYFAPCRLKLEHFSPKFVLDLLRAICPCSPDEGCLAAGFLPPVACGASARQGKCSTALQQPTTQSLRRCSCEALRAAATGWASTTRAQAVQRKLTEQLHGDPRHHLGGGGSSSKRKAEPTLPWRAAARATGASSPPTRARL